MASEQATEVAKTTYAFHDGTTDLDELRKKFDAMLAEPPEGTSVTNGTVGGVPGLWVSAPSCGDAIVLYVHGGGFILGSSHGYRSVGAALSESTGARVFLVDYTRAPEAPFPAAYDQVIAVYRGLVADGVDTARIVVAGDSAGGNLALAALVGIKNAGDPQPAGGVLLSPFADLTLSGESLESLASVDPLSSKETAEQGIELYLNGADPRDSRASALFADLTGLPPLLVQVGSSEILLDDAVRIVESARRAGVKAELQVAYGQIHVFQMFPDQMPQAQAAIDDIGEFVRAQVGV